ncbi:MAG: cytochrome P450 [Halioglobus sp.]
MELPTIPSIKTTDPRVVRAAMRDAARHAPAAIEEGSGLVYVLGYHDSRRVLLDRELKGGELALFDLVGLNEGPLRDWYAGIMFAQDGPPHHRLRRLVSKAFTPRAVQTLRPIAAALIDKRLARLQAAGSGDLVALLHDVPMHVMCVLLGVPEADVPRFLDWVDALTPVFVVMSPAQIEAATAAIDSLLDYTTDLCRRREAEPADDLISALIAAEEDGDRLTRAETAAMIANLLVAGHDTTASQTCCSSLTLLQHPHVMALLQGDADLLASVTEETVRFEPSISASGRVPASPFEVAGEIWPAGTFLMCAGITANRDPQVWDRPDDFVAERFLAPGAPKMMSFGAGGHFCLGAALARMTLEEVVRGVSALAPTLAADVDTLEWIAPLGAYPRSLPVTV